MFDIIVIVAIVVVVAVVVLILNLRGIGEAISFRKEMLTPTRVATTRSIFKLPVACLKDYEIQAYAIEGQQNTGEFEVSGDHFTLTVGGQNYRLTNGVVGIDSTLIQSYAGGLRGVEFDFVGACSSDYAIEAYYDDDPSVDASFTIGSTSLRLRPVSQQESFTLNIGQTKVLRDGTKIILKNAISQSYAGGLHGVVFELICS